VHTPGSHMRIANRREDGVWLFDDPKGTFSPAGISDLDLSPSSASSFKMKKYDDERARTETPPPPPAYSHQHLHYLPD
jgi:hypothetical protein